jgi:hypothetical protein
MSTIQPPAFEPGNFIIRLLLIAVYALIMFVVKFVLQGVVAFQLLCHLISGGASLKAQKLGQIISEYIYRMWLYMTYNTNEKPFPFGSRKR